MAVLPGLRLQEKVEELEAALAVRLPAVDRDMERLGGLNAVAEAVVTVVAEADQLIRMIIILGDPRKKVCTVTEGAENLPPEETEETDHLELVEAEGYLLPPNKKWEKAATEAPA